MGMALELFHSLLNIGLRGLGLVSRFALMIYIAKYLDLDFVGAFGLVYGALAILPVFLGFGLNYRLNREIVELPIEDAGRRMRDRLSVTVVALIGFRNCRGARYAIWVIWTNPTFPSRFVHCVS